VLAALFALAERTPVSGADLMLAYAVGFEAGVRTGWSAPGHHKGGWHLTGTLGTIAAGVAGGKLLKLDPQRLTYAMGIAATQAAGMQQNRGTMCKSFHAGKAAANGVLAAMVIVAIVALMAEGLLTLLERRLLRWRPSQLSGREL